MPMVFTIILPVCLQPGYIIKPIFGKPKVIVVVAKIASLSTTPVLALTPLGISIDKTGLFEVFTIWIHFLMFSRNCP